jgi:hypothetical protein
MAKPPGAAKVVAPARGSKARLAHGGHALLQCNNLPHGPARPDLRHTSVGATTRSAQHLGRRNTSVGATTDRRMGDRLRQRRSHREPDGRQRGSACERAGLFARTDSQGRMDLTAT